MNKNYNFDEIIPRTGTDCVKYDLRKVFFGTEDVIPMWVADMDFRTPMKFWGIPSGPNGSTKLSSAG